MNQGPSERLKSAKATGSTISGSRQPKNKIRCGVFINFRLWSLIFQVKKPEIYYSEPRSTTFKERVYISDSQNCPEMEKENQIIITIVA